MTKQTAIRMVTEYCVVMKQQHRHNYSSNALVDAARMSDRWPKEGSENKAMRWLGYIQGVCVCDCLFTLEEVKQHSKQGYVIENIS